MRKIYFARHGECEANLNGKYAGWDDSVLTVKGSGQARQVAEEAKGLEITYILSSDLKRTYETAKIVASEIDYGIEKIQKDQRLRECYLGKLVGTPSRGLAGYLQYGERKNNLMEVEFIDDIRIRLRGLIEDIGRLSGNILLVGHNGSGLILKQLLEGKDAPLSTISIPNGHIVRFA